MTIKYINFFKLKIKEGFQYRGALFLQLLFGFVPLIGYLILWHAIYIDRSIVGGLTEKQMITYYLVSRSITVCITPNFQWEMSQDIREGNLVKFLTKPISYFYYRLITHLSTVITQFCLTLFPILLFFVIFSSYVIVPTWYQLLLFIFFLIGAVILSFLLFYSMMLFAFFITEIASLSYTLDMVVQFFSGALLPLSLFPSYLKKIIEFTPFPYVSYFPVRVFLTSLSNHDYIYALLTIFIWVGILCCLIKLLWHIGLRRFAGNGA